MSQTGDLVLLQLSTPVTPTVTQTGTPGTTDYGYKVVAISEGGGHTEASEEGTTGTGADTLDFENFNAVAWQPVSGAVSYDVYRTTAAGTTSTTGKIGNTTNTVFNDTGFAGDDAEAPSTNTTGEAVVSSAQAIASAIGGDETALSTLSDAILGVGLDGGDPVDETAATADTPYGFSESQANGLLATVAAMRTALQAFGILAADEE